LEVSVAGVVSVLSGAAVDTGPRPIAFIRLTIASPFWKSLVWNSFPAEGNLADLELGDLADPEVGDLQTKDNLARAALADPELGDLQTKENLDRAALADPELGDLRTEDRVQGLSGLLL